MCLHVHLYVPLNYLMRRLVLCQVYLNILVLEVLIIHSLPRILRTVRVRGALTR